MNGVLYEKLLSNTKISVDGCWDFQGALSAGYASLRLADKTYQGHVVSYEANKGKVPCGLVVMHKCNNRRCVNPAHLEAGTQGQNILQARIDGALPWSGLSGVTYEKKRRRWIARRPSPVGGYRMLYQGPDFFEACCARKSWENRQT